MFDAAGLLVKGGTARVWPRLGVPLRDWLDDMSKYSRGAVIA